MPSQTGTERGVDPRGRPNIAIILVDDLGYGDLGCYGARDLLTPNIDRLAREGNRFTRFYANSPVCSPTRASLMSGCYPELVGVPGVIRTHPQDSWGHLARQCVLMPQVLKQMGYATALVGKWHLGLTAPNLPNDRGFDLFRGFLGDMMDDYHNHLRHGMNYMRQNRDEISPQGHATDLFTQWTCDYLVQRRDKSEPFFLYLAYNAPHVPIQPPADALDRVRQRDPKMSLPRAKMAALIEHLDAGVGKVMQTIGATGRDRDTLVLFISDNGGDLPAAATCGPLRAGKGTVYEGGIRVPCVARWPGRIPAGTHTGSLSLTMDVLPTLLELTGMRALPGTDGQSFLPSLLGQRQAPSDRPVFFTRREGGNEFCGMTIDAVIRGDWKLLHNSPYGPLELYNLRRDPAERDNAAEREPKVLNEMAALLRAHFQRGGSVPWQPLSRA